MNQRKARFYLSLVILGGLITSTLVNLFVVPSLYLVFGKRDSRSQPRIDGAVQAS